MKVPENLHIQQKKEMLEAFTGVETKNQYSIKDDDGDEIGYAAEKEGNTLTTLARIFYSKGRPLEIEITDKEGDVQLILSKGFHFLLPHYEIKTPDGQTLVKAKTRFAILKKKIDIVNEENEVLFTAKAKPFHFSRLGFQILRNNEEKAKITKQWSGMGKEIFTDADNFHVELENVKDEKWRKVLLTFAFAIDLTFFERG